MPTLTKEQILAIDDLTTEVLEVKEWGGSIIVRTITGTERDALEASISNDDGGKNMENLRAKLVVMSVVDEEGNKLFTMKDLNAIGAKSARVLSKVFTVAMRLSGFSKKDVDELTENLSGGQSADSTSG